LSGSPVRGGALSGGGVHCCYKEGGACISALQKKSILHFFEKAKYSHQTAARATALEFLGENRRHLLVSSGRGRGERFVIFSFGKFFCPPKTGVRLRTAKVARKGRVVGDSGHGEKTNEPRTSGKGGTSASSPDLENPAGPSTVEVGKIPTCPGELAI